MNKEELKQYIDDNIYENPDRDITGEALNAVLKAIVDDGGTEVEANPEGDATTPLNKIKIGETTYKTDNPFVGKVQATDAERLQALANVSNQEAGYDSSEPPVFTGKMGYVVLQPEKQNDATTTFAAQIANKPNTIFEIRDVFDLGGTQETPVSVTIPANCTLKFNGGMLKNGTINFNNSKIDANVNKQIFDNIVVGSVITYEVSLGWFGGTSITATQFNNVVDKCTNVFAPIGTYSFTEPITIKWTSELMSLRGDGYYTLSDDRSKRTIFSFNKCNGFVVNKSRVHFDNFLVSGVSCSGVWDSVSGMYIEDEDHPLCYGFDLGRDVIMENIYISRFGVGIEMNRGNIVGAVFRNIIFENSGNIGLEAVGEGDSRCINNCMFEHLYFVNTGHKYDPDDNYSTQLKCGHGMVLESGSANIITNCTFEYNTGCGLYIKPATSTGYVKGLFITNNHFEGNRYAQLFLHVTQVGNWTQNISVFGNLYSMGISNITIHDKLEQEGCVLYNESIYGGTNSYLQNVVIDELVGVSVNRGMFAGNIASFNTIYYHHQIKVVKDNNISCYKLTKANYKVEVTMANYSTLVNKGVYRVSVDTKLVGSSASSRVVSLALRVGGIDYTTHVSANSSWSNGYGLDGINNMFFLVVDSNNTQIQFKGFSSSALNTSGSNEEYILLKNLQIEKIDESTRLSTYNRNLIPLTSNSRLTLFDATLGQLVTWNGTEWTNIYNYSASKIKGTSDERPPITYNNIGYNYLDTTLKKEIVISLVAIQNLGTVTNIQSGAENTFVSIQNPYSEGKFIEFRATQFLIGKAPKIYFTKEQNNITDAIEVKLKSKGETATYAFANYEVVETPDNSEYPYIYFYCEYAGATFLSAKEHQVEWRNVDGTPLEFTITKPNNEHIEVSGGDSISSQNSYIEHITAEEGYSLSDVNVEMNGEDITSFVYNQSTGAIYIASVTGNIVITATATLNT